MSSRLLAWCGSISNRTARYTAKSFAPLMAKAAKLAIVEAENIVEVGEIDPNDVDLPGIFIDRIVPATEPPLIEILKTRSAGDGKEAKAGKGDAQVRRDRIARRAAKELKPGFYVNLGVGKGEKSIGAQRGTSLTHPHLQASLPWLPRSCLLGSKSGSSPRTASSEWATTRFPTKLTREFFLSLL